MGGAGCGLRPVGMWCRAEAGGVHVVHGVHRREPFHPCRVLAPGWPDSLKEQTGRRGRTLFQPLRLALTGEEHGPEMAALLPLIGHERAASRLRLSAL